MAIFDINNIILDELGPNLHGAVLQGEPPVHIFKLSAVEHDTIDAWANATRTMIATAAANMEMPLAMHDVSDLRLLTVLTPYIRKKAPEIYVGYEHVEGKAALVVSRNVVMHIARNSAQGLIRRVSSRRQVQLFFNHADALKWLQSR